MIAADAIYHMLCYARFTSCLPKEAGTVKIGRPIKEIANDAFNMVCKELERSYESGIYTVKQLHQMMVDFIGNMTGRQQSSEEAKHEVNCEDTAEEDVVGNDDTEFDNFVENEDESFADMETDEDCDENGNYDFDSTRYPIDEQDAAEYDAYSRSHLFLRLKQKYGDHLYISELHGRKKVVCFRNFVCLLVKQTWKERQNEENGNCYALANEIRKSSVSDCKK